MGFRIFVHAIGLVFRHFADALRIGVVPYLLAFAVLTGVALFTPAKAMAAGKFDALSLVAILVLGIAFMVANLWIAVAWHRYVLLDEMPGRFAARFNGNRILAYFGRSLLLGLAAFVLLFVVAFTLTLATSALGAAMGASGAAMVSLTLIPLLVAYSIFAVLIYRWGLILPAAAIGKPIGMGEAWAATAGASRTILSLAVVSVIAFFLLALSVTLLSYVSTWAGLVWNLAASWMEVMVGVSILTTLYGYYVEKRTIS